MKKRYLDSFLGRRFAKVRGEWKLLSVQTNNAPNYYVTQPGVPDFVIRLDKVPVETRHLFLTLLKLLDEQSTAARIFVGMADADFDAQARRAKGGPTAAAKRKAKNAERDASWKHEAMWVRKVRPDASLEDIAQYLKDKGRKGVTRQKVGRLFREWNER